MNVAIDRSRRTILAIIAALTVSQAPAGAEERGLPSQGPTGSGLPLPTFARCTAPSPPELPERWRAVALMMPFDGGQIDVGELIYDGVLPAMRATIYGLESGTADLLITETETYQLSGPHHAPTGCSALGRQLAPPARRWLSAQAQCAGQAPVGGTEVEWWRMPSENSGATWFWHRSGSRLPWRSLITTPLRDPAVIGEYAMTYFPVFEPATDTNLARLRNFCEAATRGNKNEAATEKKSVRAIIAESTDGAANAERTSRIQQLIPGLSHEACADVAPIHWPRRLAMTAIMVPTPFTSGPFPTEVFYDWDGAHAMLTRMHHPDDPSVTYEGLLAGERGYNMQAGTSGALTCRQEYPGIVKPDWLATQCTCRGVIKNNSQLSPGGAVEIRSCPVVYASHSFWAWYAVGGRPLMSLATVQSPGGLILADYADWAPGGEIAPGTLDVPSMCTAPDNPARLPTPLRLRFEIAFAARCSACHMTTRR
jgi:hypothetical protein